MVAAMALVGVAMAVTGAAALMATLVATLMAAATMAAVTSVALPPRLRSKRGPCETLSGLMLAARLVQNCAARAVLAMTEGIKSWGASVSQALAEGTLTPAT